MSKENFNANGQVVYINPKWVTGETCLFRINNPMIYNYGKQKFTEFRKEFIEQLEKEGFIITYDRNDINEDTICLIMDEDSWSEDPSEHDDIQKKKFDQKIFEAGGKNLNYPYTLTVQEYFKNPFFPAVFKNESQNGGIDKFQIDTPEQLEKIKELYDDFYWHPQIKEAFDYSIFQQLIETPTNNKTYMRILMSSSGDVMGASLKYSNPVMKKRELSGVFEPIFLNEKSAYFLNCKSMFNYYSNGGNIYFPQPRYSNESKRYLKAHGIDEDNPSIPSEVLEVASNIATKCNRELGIISGIDFIYNKNDNKWYYLEIQAFPAIEEWAVAKGIRKFKTNDDIDGYIKYMMLEKDARHDALIMHTKKKQKEVKDKPKTLNLKR